MSHNFNYYKQNMVSLTQWEINFKKIKDKNGFNTKCDWIWKQTMLAVHAEHFYSLIACKMGSAKLGLCAKE